MVHQQGEAGTGVSKGREVTSEQGSQRRGASLAKESFAFRHSAVEDSAVVENVRRSKTGPNSADESAVAEPAVVGRIGPAEQLPIRGEGVQIKVYTTQQGFVMRADHIVRDFLEGVHKELGDIIKGAPSKHSPAGFLTAERGEFDALKLEGLINRSMLLLEEHANARHDGFQPSLIVRNVASEALKLFEHLQLDYSDALQGERLSRSEQRVLLEKLVELRADVRNLLHHFDAQMLPIGVDLVQRAQQRKADGDGPRAA